MKKLQALLIALAGAAAAIPGIAATRDFDFPDGTGPLFQFALATFSSAVVLIGYVARKDIQRMRPLVAAGLGTLGMGAVLALFVVHLVLMNTVMVQHSYDSSSPTFFPLYLSAKNQQIVDTLGGRRKVIETQDYGPGVVTEMSTEWNVGLTVGTLIVSYTALIGSAALLFAFLGFHAVGEPEKEDVVVPEEETPVEDPGPPAQLHRGVPGPPADADTPIGDRELAGRS